MKKYSQLLCTTIVCLYIGFVVGNVRGMGTIVDSVRVTKDECEVINGEDRCKLDIRYIKKY